MKWTVARLVAELRDRCQRFRAVLGEQSLASDTELAAYWPGGDENASTDPWGWAYAYAQYSRMLGRMEQRDAAQAHAGPAGERAARDIARGAPATIELDAVDDGGVPKTLTVYPKSFHAILCVMDWGGKAIRAYALYDDLMRLPPAHYGLFAEHGGLLIANASYYERLIAWALSHPSPGLPFGDGDPPEPPAWTGELSPFDLARLKQAHQLVNGGRLAMALRGLTPPTGATGKESGWSTILSVGAKEIGVPLQVAARDIALESVVAQVALIREAERTAATPTRGHGPTGLPEML